MVEIRKGKRIAATERSDMDRTKMAVLVSRPRDADVEGQAVYEDLFMCPYCGNVGWAMADSDVWRWVLCGNCGGSFQV